jgi:hypothetical protein
MYQSQVRVVVALIVIVGHFLVFAAALSFGLLQVLFSQDAFEILLMASPVLSATGLAALLYILENETNHAKGKKVTHSFSIIVIVVPTLLILVLASIFAALLFQFRNFGPDQLKIALGATETFFGAYLGAISKKLFSSDQ